MDAIIAGKDLLQIRSRTVTNSEAHQQPVPPRLIRPLPSDVEDAPLREDNHGLNDEDLMDLNLPSRNPSPPALGRGTNPSRTRATIEEKRALYDLMRSVCSFTASSFLRRARDEKIMDEWDDAKLGNWFNNNRNRRNRIV